MSEKYTVLPGDCIHSIAFERGFFPDTVWNYPANQRLKQLRKDPHILLPGDVVAIPDKRPKKVSKVAGERHRFRLKGVPKRFRVQFLRGTVPFAGTECFILVDDAEREDTTDGGGWLDLMIPPETKLVAVLLGGEYQYFFHLGELDPVEEASGIAGRLWTLGYLIDEPEDPTADALATALERFQANNGIRPTGTADGATRAALIRLVGA